MHKCLRITLIGEFSSKFLQSFILDRARSLNLEGTGQLVEEGKKARIIVCGAKDAVDTLLDFIHKGSKTFFAENIEIEPFLKDKDYRGVFRIIE